MSRTISRKSTKRAIHSGGRGSIGSESRLDIYAQRKTQETLKLSIFGVEKLQNPTYGLFKRSLWFIATCLCFTICCWQLGDRFSLYLSHPTAIQMTLNRTCDIEFPTFTLCPAKSPFDVNITRKLYSAANTSIFCVNDPKACHDITNVSFDKLGLTLDELWEEFSVTPDDVTVWTVCSSAEIKENRCHRPANSTMSQVTKLPSDNVLGKCLRITMDVGSKYHGASTFLEIQMMHGQHHHFINQQMIAAKYYFQSQGKVNRVCGVSVQEELPLGVQLVVRLQRKQFQHLNMPWKSCQDSLSLGNCIERCVNALLTKNLQCRLPFHNISELQPCNTFQQSAKVYQTSVAFYKRFNSSQCHCDPPCKETVYTAHITKSRSMSDANQSSLWIQFADDLLEVATEVETYKGGDLLSDIGGSLGFFLGICILHVLELFDELFQMGMEIIGVFLSKRRNKGNPVGYANLNLNTNASRRPITLQSPNAVKIRTVASDQVIQIQRK